MPLHRFTRATPTPPLCIQLLILFTGLVAFGVNLTVFLIIGKTSPVTCAVPACWHLMPFQPSPVFNERNALC